jgi:hypothetical protein
MRSKSRALAGPQAGSILSSTRSYEAAEGQYRRGFRASAFLVKGRGKKFYRAHKIAERERLTKVPR